MLGGEAGFIKNLACHSKDYGLCCECIGEPRNDFKEGVLPQVKHLFNSAPVLKTLQFPL